MSAEKIAIENVIRPGKTYKVDRAKYEAMRQAFMTVLPAETPGMTVAEVIHAVQPHLPETLFPGGDTAGWWVKAVQLDLEAKQVVRREKVSPLRLHRA